MPAHLLQFFFFCASVFSYVAFVSLCVPHLSFFWCIGRTMLRDSGISLCLYLHFLTVGNDEFNPLSEKKLKIYALMT